MDVALRERNADAFGIEAILDPLSHVKLNAPTISSARVSSLLAIAVCLLFSPESYVLLNGASSSNASHDSRTNRVERLTQQVPSCAYHA